MRSIARRAANRVLEDLRDRSGLDNAWEGIDPETQDEIVESWVKAIDEEVYSDVDCVVAPDGSCVAPDLCMHSVRK